MQEVVIVSATRSPICRATKGALAGTRPDILLTEVLKAVLSKTPQADRQEIDDIIIGCATQEAEQGLNLARHAAVLAGIPMTVPAITVNRLCASSSSAFCMGAAQIAAGQMDVVLVGGVESTSRVPLGGYNPNLSPGILSSYPESVTPPGVAAENLARKHSITRKKMDAWALESQQRAAKCWETGRFQAEVTPIRTYTLAGEETVVTQDDTPRKVTLDSLNALPPIFVEDGQVTVGNTAPLADGAAALLLMSAAKAKALGVEPLAIVRGMATVAGPADVQGVTAAQAARKVLDVSGLRAKEMQVYEIGEQHAATLLSVLAELELDADETVNPCGGAIALGHPTGAVGVRMLVTLIHELLHQQKGYGLMAQSGMSGLGAAILLERA